MKRGIFILFLVFYSNVFAQSGDYYKRVETKKGEIIEWTLNLRPDGTFLYQFYRNLGKPYPEKIFMAKGHGNLMKTLFSFLQIKDVMLTNSIH